MNGTVLRFDRFELQLGERRLLRDGREVPIRGRAFEVLAVLARRAGQLVSKNELLESVWPGLVVEDSNIAAQIAAVRKALADDLVATVPGHGYRLTVQPPAAADAAGPLAEPAAAATPAAPTAPQLFGRNEDLARLAAALSKPGCVTLRGPGGVGKTAMARAVLAGWRHGTATWLDLAALSSGEQLLPALCRALGMQPPAGDPVPVLARTLAGHGRLLVLDNAEHLVEAVAALAARLAQAAPELHLLVTSQAVLAVRGERVERLQPLALPADDASDAQALACGALALFAERVRAADSRYPLDAGALPLMRQLCARLDGMPLALEMAATRVPLLGLGGVCDALGERFAVLRQDLRGGAARHRTLQAALDWSYGLLPAEEQRLFRALGVFSGGFTLELAVAVAGEGMAARWDVIDRIAALVDRSLVSVGPQDPPRYALLETMSGYALHMLAVSGQEQAVRARHARALRDLMAHADASPTVKEHDRLLRPFLLEMDNARQALRWAMRHDPPTALALAAHCASLATFSPWRGEVLGWMTACEPLLDDTVPQALQVLWWVQFAKQLHLHFSPRALEVGLHAMTLARAARDELALCWALVILARVQWPQLPDADAWCEEMQRLCASHPEWPALMRVLVAGALAFHSTARGDLGGALDHLRTEAALARDAGLERRLRVAEISIGETLIRLGRHAEALDLMRALLGHAGEEDYVKAYALTLALRALVGLERVAEALAEAPAALAAGRRYGLRDIAGAAAQLAAADGRVRTAGLLLGHARKAYGVHGTDGPAALLDDVLELAESRLRARIDTAALEALIVRGMLLDEAAADRLLLSRDDDAG